MRMLLLLLAAATPVAAANPAATLHRDTFESGLRQWRVEQMPGGTVAARDGTLVVADVGGCTVWFRERLSAPIEISYEVTPVHGGGPHDRVSDVNCFWMATDPQSPDAPPSGRSGKFEDYDSLRTYYVGMGGHNNTATRFRRYTGDGTKPLLPEHDLREKAFLLEPNKPYRIRIVVRSGTVEYWRNGVKLFAYDDPQPLTSGWFAFRTVKSRLEIRDFRVRRL